ncbi:MAG: prlF antitoxin for toxin YhaV toxin [Gaiellales bacterium]|jgi:AbrB family looped-hinge helix DNA binding protein|nr:prlF antitoxin for toxin YhaV toxin [Gaiellales bacterium]MDX6619573.1 prlF antitoxin for toxin YhaV toxin [Gaiellales bacterium]
MTRLTAKGQVTVPVGIRYALGLAPGDELVFSVEDGRGAFRRAQRLDALSGAFAGEARPGAHALECLLTDGAPAFAADVEAHRRAGTKLRLPDAVLLDIAAALLARGGAAHAVAAALRDILAERVIRIDHPAAMRAAIGELAAGGDALRAYALARG